MKSMLHNAHPMPVHISPLVERPGERRNHLPSSGLNKWYPRPLNGQKLQNSVHYTQFAKRIRSIWLLTANRNFSAKSPVLWSIFCVEMSMMDIGFVLNIIWTHLNFKKLLIYQKCITHIFEKFLLGVLHILGAQGGLPNSFLTPKIVFNSLLWSNLNLESTFGFIFF